MLEQWNVRVDDRREYYILKNSGISEGYLFVRKPYRKEGFDKVLEYFYADSDHQAVNAGLGFAKKYGMNT